MTDLTWRLSPDVYAAICGQDLVLLDLARDAYFCHPGGARGLVLAAGGQRLEGLDPDVWVELAQMELAAPGQAAVRPRLEFAAPEFDLSARSGSGATPLEAVGFARAFASMGLTYYRRPLGRLVKRARSRRAALAGTGAPCADVERRALAFRELLPWSPVQGACLFRAWMLLEFLAQSGLGARWVFGVRTWPFSAHCWLQDGPVVLNDSVGRVSDYSPILVV